MERPKPVLQKEKITKHRQEIMGQLLQIKNRVSGFGNFLPNLVNYLQMLCTATPVQHKLPHQIFSVHEYPIVHQEVHKLLEKCVITKVSPIPGQILCNVFFHPKKDGTKRLILNLKRFNESVCHYHFKMDSLSTITNLVIHNCCMASIDMKDAYYSIPI